MIQSVTSLPAPAVANTSRSATSGSSGNSALPPQQQAEVAALKKRDREVRAHEQAHMAAGGTYVRGGPSYDYQTGPDGQRYAVGGEVSIDVSPERSPQATLDKANAVYRAALAPADPSSQDHAVAARASALAAEARQELAQQQWDKTHQQSSGVQLVPLASALGSHIDVMA